MNPMSFRFKVRSFGRARLPATGTGHGAHLRSLALAFLFRYRGTSPPAMYAPR